jgi:hypothetical protein
VVLTFSRSDLESNSLFFVFLELVDSNPGRRINKLLKKEVESAPSFFCVEKIVKKLQKIALCNFEKTCFVLAGHLPRNELTSGQPFCHAAIMIKR